MDFKKFSEDFSNSINSFKNINGSFSKSFNYRSTEFTIEFNNYIIKKAQFSYNLSDYYEYAFIELQCKNNISYHFYIIDINKSVYFNMLTELFINKNETYKYLFINLFRKILIKKPSPVLKINIGVLTYNYRNGEVHFSTVNKSKIKYKLPTDMSCLI